ncbi:MAG: aminodeoxychorismate synthase component I [Dehalococcoidia bacterium]|nr:aminodeoxychorismate synthase component I [Dehalococcoidia bacterium]
MNKTDDPGKYSPLVEEIADPPGSLEAFELIKDRPFSFFLDSGMDPQRLGRYSFIGSDPFLVIRSRGREITILSPEGERTVFGNPFDVLGELLREYRVDTNYTGLPFVGGAVGYLGYDLGHFVERLPSTAVDDLELPECYFAFYDAVAAFDHLDGRAYIAATGFPEKGYGRRERAEARLEELRCALAEAPLAKNYVKYNSSRPASAPIGLRSNFTHEGYVEVVETVREYIMAGDIFQANISQRFEADMPLPPFELYRRLRHINPAPFAAYLNFDGVAVVSASPERFLQVQGDRVETRPIKGTRPRGKDAATDAAMAKELVNSVKDRAEHVMIVDLEWYDLGRVCRYGTVKVSELTALEKYATVFHLTSTVEGQLRDGKGVVDLLKATFPGGSITGAPKVRAMEIIDELEPTKRSVYTGSIGYLGFDGNLDLNIVIRTILVKEGRAYFQVGGAVVYDSDPEGEYIETLDKAKALIHALSMVPEMVTEGSR